MSANEKISFALATTLSLNGDPDDGTYQQYEKVGCAIFTSLSMWMTFH